MEMPGIEFKRKIYDKIVETGNIENGSFVVFFLADPCNREHKNRTMVGNVRSLLFYMAYIKNNSYLKYYSL